MSIDNIIYNLEQLRKYVLANSPKDIAITEAIKILKSIKHEEAK